LQASETKEKKIKELEEAKIELEKINEEKRKLEEDYKKTNKENLDLDIKLQEY
jgi:predicted mannosyl-3-phosphoglycerate phosphatase (HAD superfamily)